MNCQAGSRCFSVHCYRYILGSFVLGGSTNSIPTGDKSVAASGEGMGEMMPLVLIAASLSLVWIVIIQTVDPVGEFMINDDWSFVRLLQSLLEKKTLIATGWGKGGPSAIVHILWGGLFTYFVGFSITTLRISVLVMGILGSFGLLLLLRRCHISPWLALLGTLTLVFNPLFLSQCFTFMTDITFTSLAIFSVLLLHLGFERRCTAFTVSGLLFALLAILTRQIGIVIPLAFVGAILIHPQGREQGRPRMILLTLLICFLPWVSYELLLSALGSTPVTQHDVFGAIFRKPREMGLKVLHYYGCLFVYAAGYSALIVSPMLALKYPFLWHRKAFRYLVYTTAVCLFLTELGIFTGLIDPPVRFYKNVILDFGIGPILLKDTYVLGIQRLIPMPKWLYYCLVFWGALALIVMVALVCSSLKNLIIPEKSPHGKPMNISFVGTVCLLATILYLAIIMITGFFDRYLIPVCMFLIVWLATESHHIGVERKKILKLAPAILPLVLLAIFSPLMLGDFMNMKRSLAKAHNYLVNELRADPCKMDGGFEFNGYRCYRKDFVPKEGLSWWWVESEDFLVTLGPLSGYQMVRVFPFERNVGGDGAIYVLKPTVPVGGHPHKPLE